MLGFNLNKVKQWIGDKANKAKRFVGDKVTEVVDAVKNIVQFPAKIIEAVKLYSEITAKSVVKMGKPILDRLAYTASTMADRAYDWLGKRRRADKIKIKGTEYTKVYDDKHGVAYEDDKNLYIAYRGTEPAFDIRVQGSLERTMSDLISDLDLSLGKVPKERVKLAVAFYKKVTGMSDKPVKFITGHSLGGYLAKSVHFRTGKKDKTFLFNAFEHPNEKNKQSSKLIVHKIFGDPVSTFSGVSSLPNNRFIYKMKYKFPNIGAHSLPLFL